jgi:hypothetical protein
MIAHVFGVPVEELVPLVYGATAVWVAVRVRTTRLAARVREHAADRDLGGGGR